MIMEILKTNKNVQFFGLLLLMLAVVLLGTGDALAATQATCTSDPDMVTNDATGRGIVTAVLHTIVALLSSASEALYGQIIGDKEFIAARNAVLLLAVVIYGAMVVFGISGLRPGEIVGLVFKIGLIMVMTGAGAWQFFSDTVQTFFFGTMMELIGVFSGQVGTSLGGGYNNQADLAAKLSTPLAIFDWPMARIISTQFFITILGAFALENYGPILAILLVVAGYYLLTTLISALFTFIKCVVGLWFLFALAPIFFLCLMFRRTAGIFEGWLNMVINFTLQPVLLFAFLAFFITITTSSLGSLMDSVTWCWATASGSTTGTSTDLQFWRPMVVNGTPLTGGVWEMGGYLNSNGDPLIPEVFPLDTMDLMFFFLSAYIASQFANFVPTLATELSSSGLRISTTGEAARNWFASRGLTPGQIGGNVLGGAVKFFR